MGWSGQVQNESQTGTLEQLSISGHSLGEIFLARGFSMLPRQIVSFFLMTVTYTLVLPESTLDFSRFYLVILTLFTTEVGIYGVAYVFAGITLLFKRVGMFFQIINFGLLGLFWQNRETLENDIAAMIYDNFPLTQGMHLLSSAMNQSLQYSYSEYAHLVFTSLISVSLGFLLFRKMENKAREQALLSQY